MGQAQQWCISFEQGVDGLPIIFTPTDDVVMGGMSQSQFVHDADQACAVFQGHVTTDNNGGFASVRSQPAWPGWGTSVFGPDSKGVRLHVRGDGRQYKLTVRDQLAEVNYQADFAPSGSWQEVALPFADFAATVRGQHIPDAPLLRGERVRQVGFMVSKLTDRGRINPAFVPGRFRLDVRWIRPLV